MEPRGRDPGAPPRRYRGRGARRLPRAAWAHYRVAGDAVVLDVEGFLARGAAVTFVRGLLSATASRPAQLARSSRGACTRHGPLRLDVPWC